MTEPLYGRTTLKHVSEGHKTFLESIRNRRTGTFLSIVRSISPRLADHTHEYSRAEPGSVLRVSLMINGSIIERRWSATAGGRPGGIPVPTPFILPPYILHTFRDGPGRCETIIARQYLRSYTMHPAPSHQRRSTYRAVRPFAHSFTAHCSFVIRPSHTHGPHYAPCLSRPWRSVCGSKLDNNEKKKTTTHKTNIDVNVSRDKSNMCVNFEFRSPKITAK